MNFLERPQYGVTIVRVVTGIIFLVHGLQKLTGGGIGGTAGFLGSLGIPAPGVMAAILIAVEVLGGLALVLGLFTRYAAIPLAVDMLVALLTVHLSKGFMASNGGYEFVLLLLAASLGLVLTGSGALALDSLFTRRTGTTRTTTAGAHNA